MINPSLWTRLRAKRGGCAFVDVVSGREVWRWYSSRNFVTARCWLGHSRFSFWMEKFGRNP